MSKQSINLIMPISFMIPIFNLLSSQSKLQYERENDKYVKSTTINEQAKHKWTPFFANKI